MQKIIGADIIMAFDECTKDDGDKITAISAMERTHRWLLLSKEIHEKNPNSLYGFKQALFGIVQGGLFRDLREKSADFIVKAELDGIAIGGESIGFNMEKTAEIMSWVCPILPENKTRYAMGLGLNPQDLIDAVKCGFDIFDCVAPTRNARHGALYSGEFIIENNWLKFTSHEDKGRILIKKSIYAHDERPIMENCKCYTCKNFSRGYLHYLFKKELSTYANLACIHNVFTMHNACSRMRELINES